VHVDTVHLNMCIWCLMDGGDGSRTPVRK
jgi:hypothetical protein